MTLLLGIDFDNTIVSYDALFARLAIEAGYIDDVPSGGKTAIRDVVRAAHGDKAWQLLQADAYGARVSEALLSQGFSAFVSSARRLGVPLVVVSHKSVFSHVAAGGPNLRYAALAWMRANRFFEPGGLGFGVDDIYFEGTRCEKVARIRELGCTHFVDDLPEVFAEKSFPNGAMRILYAPTGDRADGSADAVVSDWFDLRDLLFAHAERAVA
ncbi:MAG: hypothetical protein O3C65_01295 [Proteobacteria bacterium]|nr:hypothetical protein [Pseudomonadota bacterium]MDA1057294.1 hypothetical protein [Pseudomonadota bacterium]